MAKYVGLPQDSATVAKSPFLLESEALQVFIVVMHIVVYSNIAHSNVCKGLLKERLFLNFPVPMRGGDLLSLPFGCGHC